MLKPVCANVRETFQPNRGQCRHRFGSQLSFVAAMPGQREKRFDECTLAMDCASDHHILQHARLAHDTIAGTPGFEILAAPSLAIFAFRATRPGLSEQAIDAMNEGILQWVNQRGKVHLSPTRLNARLQGRPNGCRAC